MININLKNKIVIVTGGAQGIGEAMVRDFAESESRVIIADIWEEKGKALAEELQNKGYTVFFKKTDVSNAEDIQALVDFAVGTYGRINILVNNAAVNIPGSILELSEEDWDKTMNINVKSQFLVSKHVVPHMPTTGGSAIVNMASANSDVAEPRLAAYVTSKGAIKMFTKSLAIDVARLNIRVNCICPGFVDTTFNDAHADLCAGGRDNVLKDIDKIHLTGRTIQPNEVSKMAIFLASDLASSITGSAVMVDGGITAGAW